MEIFLAILVFVTGIIAAIGRTWDESKSRRVKFTGWGYGAIAVGAIALIASIIVISRNDRLQKEQSDKQQLALGISQGIEEEQRKQIQQLQQLRLDRDLSGVEISFKPSAEHWALIAHACNKIEPYDPEFPYSASTIIAERVGGYWEIEFSPIYQKSGSILPPPVSTSLPKYKVFEEVIDIALVELLITWSDDDNLTSVISSRGNYPTSVTVSKDMIAFTFRPPQLRWGLNYLYDKPTVTFRGQQDSAPTETGIAAPVEIKIRSLDYRVKFDQSIKLNWEKKPGKDHFKKWMPYISGPHRLNIDWNNFIQVKPS